MRSPWGIEFQRTPERYVFGTAPSAFAREAADLLRPGARVLELGCGEGRDSVYFASRGFDVTAVELSRAGLRKGARLARARAVEVRWVCADAADLPVVGRFDLVYSCGAVHYVARGARERLFARARLMTRAGGYHAHIVFTDTLVYVEKGEVIDYFTTGELHALYRGWDVRRCDDTTIECAQDGIPHRHGVQEFIARAPTAPARTL